MYAERKGWNVGGLEVDCDYTPAERGCPTRFELVMRMPDAPQRGAGRAPAGDRRQVPGPPHARGRGHVRRAGRARHARALSSRAALRAVLLDARGGRGARRPRPHRRRRARPAVRRRDGELHAVFTRRRDDLRRHAGEISFPGGRQDDDERPARDRAARGPGGDRAAAATPSSWSARCSRRRRSSPTTRSIRSSG